MYQYITVDTVTREILVIHGYYLSVHTICRQFI